MSKEVLTEELLKELLARPNVQSFAENKIFGHISLQEFLNKKMQEKNLTRKDIIHNTNLNETHAYQIFSGERGASRNKILQIAIAMQLNLHDTNKLLHAAEVSSLYCKDRRDAIIIFCIEHSYNLSQIDEELHKFQEETISSI